MKHVMGRLSWWLALIAAVNAGCQSGGRGFSLTPPHPITREARELKDDYPDPLPLPRELDKRVTKPYIVEPGDVLLVQPSRLDSPVRLPGDQPVLPDGRIQLGVYGMLFVAGKTVEQIENDINAFILPRVKKPAGDNKSDRPANGTDEEERITVRLITRESKVYYVLGEVNAPGSFQHRGRETVLDGIIAAGGLNSNASRLNILLSRPTGPKSCRIVIPICYQDIVQLGDTSTNYQLLPGDRIYVPSRGMIESICPPLAQKCPCCRQHVACPIDECGHHSGIDAVPVQVGAPVAPVGRPVPEPLPPPEPAKGSKGDEKGPDRLPKEPGK